MDKFLDIIPLARIPLTTSQSFTYIGPSNMGDFCIGQIVEISFNNKIINGVIVGINDTSSLENIKLQSIKAKISNVPLLTANQISLARWTSEYYLIPLGVVMKTIVPKIAKRSLKNIIKPAFSDDQPSIESPFTIKYISGTPFERHNRYIELIKKTAISGKQTLLLVPELSYVVMILDILSNTIKDIDISAFHSAMNVGEHFKSWIDVLTSKSQLIIGTRQAVWAPFSDLGLIIVDEEHNSSYKQWDMNPRYDGRNVAEQLCRCFGTDLILGGTAPSVASYLRICKEEIQLESITKKFLPPTIVDMRMELKNKNYSVISSHLKESIALSMAEKRSAIILVNRRGVDISIMCRDCGFIAHCPNCSSPLSSRLNNSLFCLHCNYTAGAFLECPKCGSIRIKGFGLGTQKAEQEFLKLFPSASISVVDHDNLTKKKDIFDKYHSYDIGMIDILIGTQIVLPWANDRTKIVAALDIDSNLNFPDWRAHERSFCLISQLSNYGNDIETIVQTYNPDNRILQSILNNHSGFFYNEEIEIRKNNKYPPFARFIKLIYKNKNAYKAQKEANSLYDKLRSMAEKKPSTLEISAPAVSMVGKIRNSYIWKIILKYKDAQIEKSNFLSKHVPSDWTIDIDPDNLL